MPKCSLHIMWLLIGFDICLLSQAPRHWQTCKVWKDDFSQWRKPAAGKVVSWILPLCRMKYSILLARYVCPWGGQKHYELNYQSQHDSEKYVYYENVSKNRNGSFKQLHINSKVVPLFPCPEAQEGCPVHPLDLYIRKLLTEAKVKLLPHVWQKATGS